MFVSFIGACTNRIEGEWGVLKKVIKERGGASSAAELYYILQKHMWYRWIGATDTTGFFNSAIKMLI